MQNLERLVLSHELQRITVAGRLLLEESNLIAFYIGPQCLRGIHHAD